VIAIPNAIAVDEFSTRANLIATPARDDRETHARERSTARVGLTHIARP
jgi:hypothetical protein